MSKTLLEVLMSSLTLMVRRTAFTIMFPTVTEPNTGPIYRLKLGVANVIIISSYGLINEVLSRKEFIKYPVGTVMRMRDVIHDSLITAFHHEENWAIAHRTLVPAFGPLAIKQMFGGKFGRWFSRLCVP